MTYQGRQIARVEIAHDCAKILEFIAQDQGPTVTIEDVVQQILSENLYPLFADVIHLEFQPETDETEGVDDA